MTFTNGTGVQTGTTAFGASDATLATALTAFNATKTIATTGGLYHRFGASVDGADDLFGYGAVTLDVTSGSQVTLTRGLTGYGANVPWSVITFQ